MELSVHGEEWALNRNMTTLFLVASGKYRMWFQELVTVDTFVVGNVVISFQLVQPLQ